MNPSPPLYLSYLLRLWLAGDDDQPQWRFSLEDIRNGERKGFDSLEELLGFLKQRIKEEMNQPK